MTTRICPALFKRRSFLYRKLTDARFTELGGGAAAGRFANDRRQAERSGLLDLSLLPRGGFRGSRVPEQLASAGLPVPGSPNQASASEQGEWVLRLSSGEFWVLGSLQDAGARVDALKSGARLSAGSYPLYCQDSHAWLALTGSHLTETMAKLCGVHLHQGPFPQGAIAQTSVARSNAIVVHHSLRGLPCFSLLFDSASAEYLWDALLDAMHEFGGRAIGLEDLDPADWQ